MSLLRRFAMAPDLPALAALLGASLLLMAPGLLTGRALLPADALFNFAPWRALADQFGVQVPYNDLAADMILQNYAWKELIKASYFSGEFPLWNPAIFTGLPLLAAGQSSPLYPLALPFYLLLPTAHAYAWVMALHLFVAGAGAYLLARTLGADRVGGLVSGLAFGLCGYLVVSFMWPQMVSAAAWMPWLLLTLERMFRYAEGSATAMRPVTGAVVWAGLGALVVALQFLAGHMEISFYALFLLFCAFLFRLWFTRARGWPAVGYGVLGSGLMVGVGTLLAGAQVVPFVELIQQNSRAGGIGLGEALSYALPKAQAVAFLLPDFFGNPTHHTYFDLFRFAVLPVEGSTDLAGGPRSYPFWGAKNYVEGTAYVGLAPLALAAAALVCRRDRWVAFFGGYGVFSLLLAFGTPLYAVFFFGVPGMDQLHTPFRWVLPYSLCVAVLAGLGMTGLRQQDGPVASWLARRLGLLASAPALAGLVVLAVVFVSREALLPWVASLRERSAAVAAAFPSAEMLLSYQFRNGLVFCLMLLATGLALAAAFRWRRAGAALLVPLVLLADLAGFGWGFLAFTDPDIPEAQVPLLRWLRAQGDGQPFRVVSYGSSAVLPPDTAMLGGLHDVRGYDTVIPRQYVAFWRLMEEPSGLPYSQINRLATPEALQSRWLDLLNVRYVLATAPLPTGGMVPVHRADGVHVYENPDALPRAFLAFAATHAQGVEEALAAMRTPAFDPSQAAVVSGPPLDGRPRPVEAAQVVEYSPNRVVVRASPSQTAYLVLTDAFFDGWTAVDAVGGALEVVRAYGVFRAVLLEPGDHTVTFTYAPISFRLGGYLSFVGVVVLLLMAASVGWQAFVAGRRAESTAAGRVARNSVTPLTAQVIGRFVDFGFAVFMLRWLGPTDYGAYAFAVALIGYVAIVTDYGLGTLITRDVSQDRSLAGAYLARTLFARLVLCAGAAPLLLAVALVYRVWFGVPEAAVIAVMLFMLSLAPGSVASAVGSLFSAYQRMEYPAGMIVATTVVRALLGLAVLVAGWGVVGLGLVSVVANVFNAAMLWLLLQRSGLAPRLRFDLRGLRSMLANATPLMVNNLLNTIFFRIDIMVLQPLRGAEAVAYYSTGYKFIDGLLLISSFFTLAFFPVMSQYARTSPDLLMRTYAQALKGLLLLGLPIAMATTFIAEPLIVTFFGDDFGPAASALRILIWFLPFSYVNGLTQYLLIALNQQRYLTGAFLGASLFNLGGNLVLIPVMGMEGAALMTIVSEWVLLIPFLAGVNRHLGPAPLLILAWKPALATAAMGGTFWALSGLPLPAVLTAGGAVYLGAVLALRALDADDWALLRRALRL